MTTDVPGAVGERVSADLTTLATFSEAGPGCNRTLFSTAYQDSRAWVEETMRHAGLSVHRDPSGNIVGRLEGELPGAPPILLGSHTDTVRSGGAFDGVVGVLGAIEAARLLQERGQRLRHPLQVIDFLGEESNDHGLTCLGSRSLMGELTATDLDREDAEGQSLGERCQRTGLDPSGMVSRRRLPQGATAYLELHIEQGPVLENGGVQIGVVTAITGIERLVARFLGQPDHAGTMPMADRRDALAAAAAAVLAVRHLGCDAGGAGVATTSQVTASPGSPNVVPGSARLEAEMRSTDPVWLDTARSRLVEDVAAGARELGVEVEFEWVHDNPPQPLDDTLQSAVVQATEALGYSWVPVPSGATHDAVHLARSVPTAMIFVPSVGGRSHCPEEHTDLPDIVRGIDVLTGSVLAVDRR